MDEEFCKNLSDPTRGFWLHTGQSTKKKNQLNCLSKINT